MKKGDFTGRNIAFGIREHGMCAIANGIASFGLHLIPYASTFMVFAPYALGAIRIAALSHLPVIYVFTHDSIGVGEDGPTHQPVETLAQLRALPGLVVMRPADGKETVAAYAFAVTQNGAEKKRPVVFALSRQNLPQLEGSKDNEAEGVAKGAYVVYQWGETQCCKEKKEEGKVCEGKPYDGKKLTILSSGSEVGLCVAAAKLLAESAPAASSSSSADAPTGFTSIRVVSVPSMELFREQPVEYRSCILGCCPCAPCSSNLVFSVEAGVTSCWSSLSHSQMGVETFGLSAPEPVCYATFGLTPQGIKDRALQEVAKWKGKFLQTLVTKE